MNSFPIPAWLEDPPDPFFSNAIVVGQFRRQAFFCLRCMRREGPALHREGVMILVDERYFGVDYACAAALRLVYDGRQLNESLARRLLPFVRYRQGVRSAESSTSAL